MGIYIENMEMPTSCRACMFSRTDIRNVYWCVLTEKDLPCDCPLVPVPAHGRLIDADALLARTYEIQKEFEVAACIDALEIALAPTIIPAEEAKT